MNIEQPIAANVRIGYGAVAVETLDISRDDLIANTDQALAMLAGNINQIIEAMSKNGDYSKISLSYYNILHRDLNPDGHIGFIRVVFHDYK